MELRAQVAPEPLHLPSPTPHHPPVRQKFFAFGNGIFELCILHILDVGVDVGMFFY